MARDSEAFSDAGQKLLAYHHGSYLLLTTPLFLYAGHKGKACTTSGVSGVERHDSDGSRSVDPLASLQCCHELDRARESRTPSH